MPDETPDELHLDKIFLWNSINFDQSQPKYYHQLLEEKKRTEEKTFINDYASTSSLLLL